MTLDAPRITHILEATVGGTARHLTEVCTGLAAAGFAVEAIVSLRRGEEFRGRLDALRAAGVTVTVVPMARAIAPGSDAAALWRIYCCLRRTRPQIVHTHSSKAGILGRAAAVMAGAPVIVHSPHAFAFQMRAGQWQRAFYQALEREAARRTRCLVAVSQAEGALAVEAGLFPAKRVAVIENGINAADAAPPEAGRALRAELGIPREAPIVLFAGRLTAQKAPELLLRAAISLHREHPEAVFLLAGEGEERPRLEQEITHFGGASFIRLPGRREDMPRLYAAAQAFVLPSRWEGLPYAILEAQNAALPVVASDIPPHRELVQPEQTGLLFPPEDAYALAARIATLLADPRRAARMGAAGQAHVRARYTRERQIERLTALYRFLIQDAGASPKRKRFPGV